MKIEIPNKFIKAGVNVKNGDTFRLLDEGKWIDMTGSDGKKKKVLQFEVELMNDEIKTYTMNNTTIKNLIQEYGGDSKDWMNIGLRVHIVNQMAFGKTMKVLILTPPDWESPIAEENQRLDDISVIDEE